MYCPQSARRIFDTLELAFRPRTAARMGALALLAIVTVGRRTLTHVIVTSAGLLGGHFSTYYRLFSRPAWSMWRLGRLVAGLVIDLAPPGQTIIVAVDDTATEHPGKHVYGKGKHRDAPRSSASLVKWIWGHKWVVLTVVTPIPCVSRPWALPVLIALYRNPSQSEAEGLRHKTPSDIARVLMRRLMTWFPERKFILLGDGGYSSHAMARFARRFRKRLTFVGKFYPQAALYDPPPPYRGQGRPRVKGAKRPTPAECVEDAPRRSATVDWYGGGRRKVGLVGGQGQWYKAGYGLTAIRWVHVVDLDGTHRAEYFFSTDPEMPLTQIVSLYTRRWNIETMFQEVRQHVGLGSTRRWCKQAVLRAEPWLFGLYTVIALIYIEHLQTHTPRIANHPWLKKSEPTFADAIAEVRTLIWRETIFSHPAIHAAMKKVPSQTQETWINWFVHAA